MAHAGLFPRGRVLAALVSFPNAGFEADSNGDGKPDSWDWPNSYWTWDGSVAHSGSRSARLQSSGGASTSLLKSAEIPLKPSTVYELTYWMRTQNASAEPIGHAYQYDAGGHLLEHASRIHFDVDDGTNDWQKVTYRFQTFPSTSYVRVVLLLSGGRSGTFWFDDFALTERGGALYAFQNGFPVDQGAWIGWSSPVVADLENDGKNELLLANYRGQVFGWDATGKLLPGYPLETGGSISAHLALADLNGDGDLEIVAGVGKKTVGVDGEVYIWQPNGTLLPGWPQRTDRYGTVKTARISAVAIADLDNDSDLEVIAATANNVLGNPNPPDAVPDLYAWHHTGQLMAGAWPAADAPAIHGTVAIADFNADGRPDVVTGRDYNRLFAYDYRGIDLPGWPVYTFVYEDWTWDDPRIEQTTSGPTLADLDGDGVVELVTAGWRYSVDPLDFYSVDVLVLEPDGKRPSAWKLPAPGADLLGPLPSMQQVPIVSDLDGDGVLDVIAVTQDGWIRAYSADKELLWAFDFAAGKFIHGSEPLVGDVDGDGLYEVVFGSYDPYYGNAGPVGLWILEHDGSVKSGSPLPIGSPGIMSAPVLTDLDRDGDLDIVAVTSVGMVYVWDTPTPYDPARISWPMARLNLQRTAFFQGSDLHPRLSPSTKRVNTLVASQGDILTYWIDLVRSGPMFDGLVDVTDVIPQGLSYVPGSLTASHGVADDSQAPTLNWSGSLAEADRVEISYRARVTESSTKSITNVATVDAGTLGLQSPSATVIVNGSHMRLPFIVRRR
jgi:uncharacterized repeat protein (TIGR01451 family)